MRLDAKTDANQKDIVDALRKAGATVLILSRVGQGCPDIAVGYHGHNYFLEVKTDKGKLTQEEHEFFSTWRGSAAVVHSVDEALAFIEGDWEP